MFLKYMNSYITFIVFAKRRVFQIVLRDGGGPRRLATNGKICRGEFFYWVFRISGVVFFTIWSFLKAENDIL